MWQVEDKEGLYILLDDIVTILRKHKSSNDCTKEIRKGNIIKAMKCYEEGLLEKDGNNYCSLTSFYRYAFNHYDGFEFCKSVCDEIVLKSMMSEQKMLQSDRIENAKDMSTLNLYRTLINANILDDVAESFTPDPDSEVRFLVSDYQSIPEFTENGNWDKIVLFEDQFQNYCTVTDRTNYETVVKKKWEFLNLCIQMKESGQVCNKMASIACQKNTARRNAADVLDGITIDVSDVNHRPEILEQSVIDECKTYKQIDLTEMVVCLNCTTKCTHDPGVHVYIGLKQTAESPQVQDITTLVLSSLEKKHYVNVVEVIFLASDLLKTTENKTMRRFTVRDNMQRYRQTPGKVLHSYYNDNMMQIDVPEEDLLENKYCGCCYRSISENIRNPLQLDNFDLVQEWNRSVPLPIHAFMKNAFINTTSAQNKSDHDKLIQAKLPSLFCSWEGLLNTLSRSYIGFVQLLNTDELMVNYHNITTVFNITSLTGVTTSLRTGNRRLKKKSDAEVCHYNTFHKKYPLIYTKQGDNMAKENQISLRECHLVFMMDNLVHLANRTDPCPGEKPTNQVCTLPLTLKGVPADSTEVSSWHSETCDGSQDCECFKPKDLLQTNIETVLLVPTDAEQMAAEKLKSHSKWGVMCLWQELQNCRENSPSNEPSVEQTHDYPSIDQQDEYMGDQLNSAVIKQSAKLLHYHTIEQKEECEGDITNNDMMEKSGDPANNQSSKQTEECEGDIMNHALIDEREDQVDLPSFVETDEYEGDIVNIVVKEQSGDQVDFQSIEHTDACEEAIINSEVDYPSIGQTDECKEDIMIEQSREQVDYPSIEQIGNSECTEEKEQTGTMLLGTSLSLGEAKTGTSVVCNSMSSIRDLLETIQEYELSTGSTQLCDIYSYFQKYSPPPLLCRHLPPASGKDDDIIVLKNILDDIIIKADLSPGHRILFGPDFKIANNVFKLMEKNTKYQCILPEFPVLHLRKSKITNLISAYKACGLIHIIQYMKDEDTEKDWTKLLSIDNIEKATRNIWRLATGLQIALMSVFHNTLTETDKQQLDSLADPSVPAEQIEELFGKKYESFIQEGCQKNATFCLHYEILHHSNEIVSIAVAERLGGEDGYNLLLSAVKSSLRFSFLNGATSYAGFCVRLLLEHNKASHFHQNMKKNLFSTPHNDSSVNFGLDTAREIDHRIAKKCIRPGSDLETILPKMSTVDDQHKVHVMRQKVLLKTKIEYTYELSDNDSAAEASEKYLGKKVTSTDKQHIFRVTNLILRQGGLQMHSNETVWNVYQSSPAALPDSILDRETADIGTYLVKKFVAQTHLFGMTEKDIPSTKDLTGPKVLVSRVKQAKGTTIARSRTKTESKGKTQKEIAESKRKQKVQKMSKIYDCMSSSMNTCQAIFRADGSKASTTKSTGVKKALLGLLNKSSGSAADSS